MSPLYSCLISSGTRHTNQRYVAWQSHRTLRPPAREWPFPARRTLIRITCRVPNVTLFMMCLVCRHDKSALYRIKPSRGIAERH
jgi:hypothetical protein